MSVSVAHWIVIALGVYAGIGVLFAVPFAFVGASRLDSSARSGTLGFRLLILPGAAAFWPLLLRRWLSGDGRPPEERSPHRDAAKRSPEERP